MTEQRYSAAYGAVLELAIALKTPKFPSLPGLWECRVDDNWRLAVNGRREDLKASDGQVVRFGECFVWWGDFPAGVLHPWGGFLAAGALANEDTFVAAVKARTEAAKAGDS